MDKNKIEVYKGKLILLENETKEILSLMHKNGTDETSEVMDSELSNYDNHPADLGTEVFMIGMNKALKTQKEYKLKEIQEAILRADNAEYGLCLQCGSEIAEERLEILPFTKFCMHCEKEKSENSITKQKYRPIEESAMNPPFGRKYLNKREDDEHEGLDNLNDLVKYGSSDTPQDMGGYHEYKDYYKNDTDKQGIVDKMDRFSNDDYKRQIPD